MTSGEKCTVPGHRYFRDPATDKRRCIEHEEAWLDRLSEWLRQYKRRQREARRTEAA